ncbi:MAG: hypothetical protein M3Y56_04645 [Armatimonadota bacterium]|nr:hypothetical protein [Armatimonadota bacterium]
MAEKSETFDSLQDGTESITFPSRRDLRLGREKLNGSTPVGAEMVAGLVEEQTKRLRALCDAYISYIEPKFYRYYSLTILMAAIAFLIVSLLFRLPGHPTTILGETPPYFAAMLSIPLALLPVLHMLFTVSRRSDTRSEIETASKLLTRLVRKLSQIEEHTAIDSYTAIEFDFILSDAEAAINRANRLLSIRPEAPAVSAK